MPACRRSLAFCCGILAEIICAAGVQEYCDVDGKRRTQHLECDDESWSALIERFFAVPDGQPDDALSMGGGT